MTPVADGLLDPERAGRVLSSATEALLRLAPAAGEAEGASYGPAPVEPRAYRITRGARAIVPEGSEKALPVDDVAVETRKLDWGGWGGSPFSKHLATVIVRSGEQTLVAAHVIDTDEARAREAASALAAPLEGLFAGDSPSGDASTPALSAETARRLALVLEGDYLVLRDFETRGPREHIARYAVLSAICAALSALTWLAFARELTGPRVLSALLGYAAVGLVLALGAVAMGEIARFASKYRAKGAPVAWFHDDRVVVGPWVSRSGAIDRQPEGRLGAAIRIAEVDDVVIKEEGGAFIVSLDTQHGPMDVLTVADRELARLYQTGILRSLCSVAAPAKRPRGVLRALAST